MMHFTDSDMFQVVFSLVAGLLSLLLFGNIFFLKKLVHKIDQVDPLSMSIAALTYKVDELCSKVNFLYDFRKFKSMRHHEDPGI